MPTSCHNAFILVSFAKMRKKFTFVVDTDTYLSFIVVLLWCFASVRERWASHYGGDGAACHCKVQNAWQH